jgi:hypothetical protein
VSTATKGPGRNSVRVPYVIDNQAIRLADVLANLLHEHHGKSLDIATAYFTVGAFGLIQPGLLNLGNLRVILGAEPTTGEQVGLRPEHGVIKGLIRRDLEPYSQARQERILERR